MTNKTLRDAYEAAPRTFQPIARRATAADFKDMHRVQLGEAPQLDLPPGKWTPGYAAWSSACSGVRYPRAEWSR